MRPQFLFIIFLLILCVPSVSNAEWLEAGKNVDGDVYYLDPDKIRKQGDSVYYWQLADLLKPNSLGILSVETYIEGDCKVYGVKVLTFAYYKLPMGKGDPVMDKPSESYKDWTYPPTGTSMYRLLNQVCRFISKE